MASKKNEKPSTEKVNKKFSRETVIGIVVVVIMCVTVFVVWKFYNEDYGLSETEQMELTAREAQDRFESQMMEGSLDNSVPESDTEGMLSITDTMENLITTIGLESAAPYEELLDNLKSPEDGDENLEIYQDRIYLLCQTDSGSYSAYGFTSTAYGACGILICAGSNEPESYQYFGDAWEISQTAPTLSEGRDSEGALTLDFTFQSLSSDTDAPITVTLTQNEQDVLVSDQSLTEGMLYYQQ